MDSRLLVRFWLFLSSALLLGAFLCPAAQASPSETTLGRYEGNLGASARINGYANASTVAQLDQQAEIKAFSRVFAADGTEHSVITYFFHVAENTWRAETYTATFSIQDTPEVVIEYLGRLAQLDLAFDAQGILTSSESSYVIEPLWEEATERSHVTISFDSITQYPLPTTIPLVGFNGCSAKCGQAPNDFDGDGESDLTIWRPESGFWAVWFGEILYAWKQWGLPGDRPISGDYDGDGRADFVVWRPSNGTWYICKSTLAFDCRYGEAIQYGLPGDKPIAGVFFSDGAFTPAVYRPSTNSVYMKEGPYLSVQWGLPGDVVMGVNIGAGE